MCNEMDAWRIRCTFTSRQPMYDSFEKRIMRKNR